MKSPAKIAHSVYCTLVDKSPAARQKIVESCNKHLSGHPGSTFLGVGVLTEELNRPVNDREFQVAFHVVFDSLEYHNKYQVSDGLSQFIE